MAPLLRGLTAAQLADATGYGVRQVRRWRAAGRLPLPAVRALEARAGILDGWDGWDGWRVERGELVNATWRRGLTGAHILSLFFREQEAAGLRRELGAARERIAALEAELMQADQRAARYRRIIATDGTLGLALGITCGDASPSP